MLSAEATARARRSAHLRSTSSTTRIQLVEPLSPELALVDPELARRARDRLPPTGETHASPGRALSAHKDVTETSIRRSWASTVVAPENPPSAAPSFAPARSGSDPASTKRQLPVASGSRRRVRVFLGAVGVLLAAIAVYALAPDSTVREEAANRAPKKASTRANPARPFGTTVFNWQAVSDAAFYKVEFFRNGREVFEALSSRARLELPTRWVYRGRTYQLVAGSYFWKVVPAFGPRSRLGYGEPIVRSTWVARR